MVLQNNKLLEIFVKICLKASNNGNRWKEQEHLFTIIMFWVHEEHFIEVMDLHRVVSNQHLLERHFFDRDLTMIINIILNSPD